jgi:hypothetical protein
MLQLATVTDNPQPRRRRLARAWLPADVDLRAAALLMGVTVPTARSWRSGRCRPQPRFRRRLAALRTILAAH